MLIAAVALLGKPNKKPLKDIVALSKIITAPSNISFSGFEITTY